MIIEYETLLVLEPPGYCTEYRVGPIRGLDALKKP